jgi:23S rRNA (cytidine1920-2'-O)/16S rRNA (cytidine1409-2'-O)-methyltransferase
MRLDSHLAQRGLARSRTDAQNLIAQGCVRVNGEAATRPSRPVAEGDRIEVSATEARYVSRAGYKLEGALDRFQVEVAGRRCLDLGVSTGGFTDCLLQRGAASVCAIDVGHGQTAARIAGDARVVLREGVNARFLTPDEFDGAFDLVTVDLSFISLTLVLPAIRALLAPSGECLALVKPQFEVGAEGLGKGGIVRDPARRAQAVERVATAAAAAGLRAVDRMESPIAGGDGNVEYFLRLTVNASPVGNAE